MVPISVYILDGENERFSSARDEEAITNIYEQVNDILLEAGATLSGAMLEQGLVDEIILYQAPVLMGDVGRMVDARDR